MAMYTGAGIGEEEARYEMTSWKLVIFYAKPLQLIRCKNI